MRLRTMRGKINETKTERQNQSKTKNREDGQLHISTGLCYYSNSILSRLSSACPKHQSLYKMAPSLLRPKLVEICSHSNGAHFEDGR